MASPHPSLHPTILPLPLCKIHDTSLWGFCGPGKSQCWIPRLNDVPDNSKKCHLSRCHLRLHLKSMISASQHVWQCCIDKNSRRVDIYSEENVHIKAARSQFELSAGNLVGLMVPCSETTYLAYGTLSISISFSHRVRCVCFPWQTLILNMMYWSCGAFPKVNWECSYIVPSSSSSKWEPSPRVIGTCK